MPDQTPTPDRPRHRADRPNRRLALAAAAVGCLAAATAVLTVTGATSTTQPTPTADAHSPAVVVPASRLAGASSVTYPASDFPAALVPQRRDTVTVSVPAWGADATWLLQESTAGLNDGPSWFPETSEPGEPGTVGVTGHRTGLPGWVVPFRDVDTLDRGDTITLSTREAVFSYRVVRTAFEVPETRTEWIAPVPGDADSSAQDADTSSLVLVTCTIPTSSRRVVVVAELATVRDLRP